MHVLAASSCIGRTVTSISVQISSKVVDDPLTQAHIVTIDDPLEKIARRYGRMSDAYLCSRPDFPFEMRFHPSGPTPFEVFAWYHRLVPAKVFRAIVSAAAAARGDLSRHDDALISAKVALLGTDRSLDALAALAAGDDDPRLDALQAQLRRLRREVEGRFPSALGFVRPGLDVSR
jgi:hypothetical protein